MKISSYLLLPFLASCADRPIVYVGTQLGVHAQGVKDGYPNKVSVGYDRQELAWLPDANRGAVIGGFDGEISGINGVAISEVLATGDAATGVDTSGSSSNITNSVAPFTQTLIVSTNTKFNLGIEAASSDGASPSMNAGFKRSVLALFPAHDSKSTDIPSTYSDITVHAGGFAGSITTPKGIPNPQRQIDNGNGGNKGIRVVQTLATGKAARLICEKDGKQLIDGVISEIGKKKKEP